MKSFLLSWLTRRYAAGDRATFERDCPGEWVVWEAGPWRPPTGSTMIATPAPVTSGGESLAIALQAKNGGAEVTLGRGAENDLAVGDGTLSRVHLVFHRLPAGLWTVRDAGSSNGTQVDGVRVVAGPVTLQSGARIEAGQVRLTFYDAFGLFLRLRGAG